MGDVIIISGGWKETRTLMEMKVKMKIEERENEKNICKDGG